MCETRPTAHSVAFESFICYSLTKQGVAVFGTPLSLMLYFTGRGNRAANGSVCVDRKYFADFCQTCNILKIDSTEEVKPSIKIMLVLVLLFAICLGFVWKAIISHFKKYVKKTAHLTKTHRCDTLQIWGVSAICKSTMPMGCI
jgi:NADH:ubiquinone oxidoreductase subunit 5 (subunit L)/multisubunit Na+/H+ antiporter MnhA subunit